jgi:hypothetical protein
MAAMGIINIQRLPADAARWATPPQTVDEEIDRLIADPDYLAWTIIRNNPEDIRQKGYEHTVKDAVDAWSVRDMYDIAKSMEPEDRAHFLDVRYLSGHDPLADQAFAKMFAQVKTGAGMDANQRRSMEIDPVSLGLSVLTTAIGAIGAGKRKREAEAQLAAAQAQAKAQAEANGRKLKQTLTITGIIVGIVLVVSGLVYAYRKAS